MQMPKIFYDVYVRYILGDSDVWLTDFSALFKTSRFSDAARTKIVRRQPIIISIERHNHNARNFCMSEHFSYLAAFSSAPQVLHDLFPKINQANVDKQI